MYLSAATTALRVAAPALPFALPQLAQLPIRRALLVLLVLNIYFDYIGNMEESDVIRCLAALAHSLRLQVFRMLVVAGPAGLTPGAIAEQLDVPAATLSFHLKELMHAQLVTQERDGRKLIYRAAYGHMDALLGFLTANCCPGEACLETGTAARKC